MAKTARLLCVQSCGNSFILFLGCLNQGSLLTQTLNQIVLDMENGIYNSSTKMILKYKHYQEKHCKECALLRRCQSYNFMDVPSSLPRH
jgi:hypothetical protein